MPKWIHDRARRLLDHNPSMPEGEAFAIATQQAHAVGKSPKGYGTAEGRETAREKYDTPRDDQKTAGPRVELYTRVKTAEAEEEGGRGKYLATALAGAGLTGAGFSAAVNGHKLLGLGAIGLGTGATAMGGLMSTLPSSTRRQIEREWHDPRLYSNLRGMATLEDRKSRVRAHRQLDRDKDYSVLGAMHEGFTRGGEKTAVSREWVDRLVRRGAEKTPERLGDFSDRVDALAQRAYRASQGRGTKEVRPGLFVDAPLVSPDTPAMRALAQRRSDVAGHASDLALDLYSKTAEVLEGGKGDDKRPSDFNAAALAKGTRHEREHTRDDSVAREIAMDHLTEDPRYYDKADLIENPRLTPLLLRLARAEERRGEKHAFETSMYSGALGYGPFQQESDLPPFRAPVLARQAEPRRAPNALAAAVTHEKTGGLKERALRGLGHVVDFATVPKGVEAHAEGLTGLNRARQVLGGQRAHHLYDAYQAETNPEVRGALLSQLSSEDSKVLQGRVLAATGLVTGAQIAANQAAKGIAKGVQRGTRAVIQKDEENDETAAARKADPEAFLHRQLDERGIGPVGKSIASRVLLKPDDTNRMTAGDVLAVPDAAFGAGLSGAVLAKPGLERLVGAQSFSHGTSPEAVRSILQHGLDPAYGGIEGGAAHQQELLAEKARGFRAVSQGAALAGKPDLAAEFHYKADHAAPKLHLMGIDQKVPMDSHAFVDNARGRAYVAKGIGGQLAAAAYSHLQDPRPLQAFAERYEQMNPIKGLLGGNVMNGLQLGRDYFYPKQDPRIVGGVLPTEDFHARFEPDPDDVTRFQTGWRSKRGPGEIAAAISPEDLHVGTPTFRQIFKARAKNYGKYVKNNPGRVAGGALMSAVPAAMAVNTLHKAKRVVDKVRGTHKTDAQKEQEKAKTEAVEGEKSAAPLSPTARLSSAQQVGKTPNMDTGGPSIQQIAKPVGFGIKLPGAGKGTTTI